MKDRDWIPPFEVSDKSEDAHDSPPPVPPQVVAEEGDPAYDALMREYAKTQPEEEPALTPAHPRRRWYRSPLGWLIGSGAVLLLIVSLAESYALLTDYYQRDPWLGVIITVPLAALFLALFTLIARELRGYWAVRAADDLRAEAARLLGSDAQGPAKRYLARISALYQERSEVKAGLERFHTQHSSAHSDRETLALYSRLVLGTIDERAYRIITRYSVDTAVLTALSPLSSVDALLSTWRNTRMIRDIARLYGVRPGFVGSFALLKYVGQNLVVAGAGDYLSDSAAEALGGQFTAALSARLGQGIANGLLTARLGMLAAAACRPAPFLPEDRHGIRRLRADIVKQVKRRMGPGKARAEQSS